MVIHHFYFLELHSGSTLKPELKVGSSKEDSHWLINIFWGYFNPYHFKLNSQFEEFVNYPGIVIPAANPRGAAL